MMKVRMGYGWSQGECAEKCEFSVAVSKGLDRTLGSENRRFLGMAGCLITHNSADGLKFHWTYYILQVSRGTSSSFLGLSNSSHVRGFARRPRYTKGKSSARIRFMLWSGQVTCRSRRYSNLFVYNAWGPVGPKPWNRWVEHERCEILPSRYWHPSQLTSSR